MSQHQSDSHHPAYRNQHVYMAPSSVEGFIHFRASGPTDLSPDLARVVAADLVSLADRLDPQSAPLVEPIPDDNSPKVTPAAAPEPTAVTPPTLAEARETLRTVTMASLEAMVAPKPTTPAGLLAYMLQSEKHILAVQAAVKAVEVAKAADTASVKADPEPADPLSCCEVCVGWSCAVEPTTGHRVHCTGVKV